MVHKSDVDIIQYCPQGENYEKCFGKVSHKGEVVMELWGNSGHRGDYMQRNNNEIIGYIIYLYGSLDDIDIDGVEVRVKKASPPKKLGRKLSGYLTNNEIEEWERRFK